MTKFLVITIILLLIVISILFLTMFISYKNFCKEIEIIKQDSLKKQNESNKKVSEVISNANKKKQKIHTDNADSDFANSLDILQNLTEGYCE